jgi:oligopeptide transport system substrate-binding protein
VEAHPRDWFLPEHIVSNGPFVLASWRVGDRIRLAANPHYWGRDAVALASIDALPVESPTTALNLFLSGEVDWLPRLYPEELVDVLRTRDDFYHGPALTVYFYRVNTRRPPLDDPRVRRAIGLAIDRREITDLVLRLGQIPATAMVPPGMPGYRSPASGLGFDVETARALLAEAGFPGGRGMREIGILYNTLDTHRKIAEVIADQLRRHLGIRATAYNQEWQSYLASVAAGDYDMARAGWIGDYIDPNTFLDIWLTGGGNNQTGWGDAAYDALVAAAADVAAAARDPERLLALAVEPAALGAALGAVAAADGAAARGEAQARLRLELLSQAEAILVQRGFPVIPIYFYVASGLVSPAVEGFHRELTLPDGSRAANLQDLHPLREVRVRRGAGS